MDTTRFKEHHAQILTSISKLRKMAHAGITENAGAIAEALKALGRIVVMHLAAEDRVLYPSLSKQPNTKLAQMSRQYQEEMGGLASELQTFIRHWIRVSELAHHPQEFRSEANQVLAAAHARIQRENREFYPMAETV